MIPYVLLFAVSAFAGDKMEVETREGIELRSDVAAADKEQIFKLVKATQAFAGPVFEKLGLAQKSKQTLRLRVYRLEADFEDFKRRTRDQNNKVNTLSFYNEKDREVAAAWQNGSDLARGEIRGQTGRQLLIQYGQNAPPWVEEAVMGYFEGFQPDPYGDPMDLVNARKLEAIRGVLEKHDYCPLYDLMDLQPKQYYGIAGAPDSARWPRETLYAESWAVFFFLMRSDVAVDQELLAATGERLETGRWSQSTFKEKLPDVERRWREFLKQDDYRTIGEKTRGAWASLAANDGASARTQAAAAIEIDKTWMSAHRALAHAALMIGDHAAATAAFGDIEAKRPKDMDALLGKARALLLRAKEQGDKNAAKDAMHAAERAVADAPPAQKIDGLLLQADIAEQMGDVKATLKYVREARKQKGLDEALATRLKDWEDKLIKASIK